MYNTRNSQIFIIFFFALNLKKIKKALMPSDGRLRRHRKTSLSESEMRVILVAAV